MLPIKPRPVFAALALFALALSPHLALAQSLNGSIVGNVKDSTGAAVGAATVTLTNTTTDQTRQVASDADGRYNFPTVPPGVYTLSVAKPGFSKFVQNNIDVTANSLIRVDPTMSLGEITQSIVVQAGAGTLQTDSVEVHNELSSQQLENVPIPVGRNYQYMLATVPGVTPPTSAHSIPSNPSRSLDFDVDGGTNHENQTRVDGASTVNANIGDINVLIPTLESIASVNIATSDFDAETGFAGAGSVAIQTKSGTNQLHGAVFESFTGDDLKARPFFLASNQQKGKLVYNEFGGAVGGKIIKDKLFYFLSYEGSRDNEYANVLQTVPDALVRAGNMSESTTPIYDPMTGSANGVGRTPFPGNIIPSSRLDPIALKISNMLPLPNVPGSSLTNNYEAGGDFSYRRDRADSKINWNPASKLTTFGRFSVLNFSVDDPAVFGAIGGINVDSAGGDPGLSAGSTYSLTVGSTYTIRPNLLLDGYFVWENDNTATEPAGTGTNLGQQLGIPGTNGPNRYQSGLPWFIVSSYSSFGTANTGGNGDPYYRYNTQHQEAANLSWTHGAHDVRFGGELIQLHVDDLQPTSPAGTGAQGGFSFGTGPTQLNGGPSGNQFNSYATFLLGLVTSASTVVTLSTPPEILDRQNWYSAYVRDRWQINSKLTAVLGLRWDYFGFPNAGTMGIANYNISTNQSEICGYGQVPNNCGLSMPKRLFSPRIGLAYRPSDTWVIRAGYGINQVPMSIGMPGDNPGNIYPETVGPSYTAPNSYSWYGTLEQGLPATVLPSLGNGYISVPGTIATYVFPKNIPWSYQESFNFTVQKQLKYGFLAQAAYVGNETVHYLPEGSNTFNLNAGQVIGAGTAGQPFYASEGRTANVNLLAPQGTANYNALQTGIERRFAQGLAIQAHYTWSKTEAPYYPTSAPDFLYLASRPVASFDRTQALTINGTWDVPLGKGRRWLSSDRVGSAIAGGWSLSALAVFYSGLPFSITCSGTSLNLPGATQECLQLVPNVAVSGSVGGAYFNPLAFAPVTTASFGTVAPYSLRGPDDKNLDLSLSRSFKLKERYNIQFRADAFNLTNTPHFANPGGNVSNLVLNSNGTVKNLAGYDQITAIATNARDGIDERQFRFTLRITF
jgi:hypothetical protein